jgi:hypothetical protein
LAEVLCQRFFRECAADAAIAVLEWMDADEIQMGDPRARERGQWVFATGRRAVEPGDKAFHFAGDEGRRRRLEMHLALIVRAGDDLHRVGMPAVAADCLDGRIAAEQHRMPVEQDLPGERGRVAAIQVRHHLRFAAFRRFHARLFLSQAELLSHRGLDAGAVENFTLDLGGLDRFVADKLDLQRFLIVRPHMLAGADKLAGLPQELLLRRLQRLGVIGKNRPIRLLPVPRHEL